MKKQIQKMQDYFVKYLGFKALSGKDLYQDNNIEYEFHMFNDDRTLYIDIVKNKNEKEYQLTMRGNSSLGNKLQPYFKYFLGNRKKVSPDLEELFKSIDKEIKNL